MSSNNGTDGEDVIQHIDDTLEEQQYVESFAPKAQEEILSETQDGTQQSISDHTSNQYENSNKDHDESVDLSNDEELNATSNKLVEDVITNAESEKPEETGEHESSDIDEGKPDSDIMEEPSIEKEEESIDKEEESIEKEEESVEKEDQSIEKEDQSIEKEDQSIEKEDQSIEKEDQSIEKEDQSIEKEDEPIDNNEGEQSVVVVSNIESEKPDENIEVDSESNVTMEEPVVEESVNEKEEIEQKNTEELKSEDPKVETEKKKTEEIDESNVKTSPPQVHGGKDIKSLSSTFKQDETITNGDCVSCNKIVYPLEKFVTKNLLYHKSCFRCTKCNSALTAGNFTFNKNNPYCQPHYVELFKKRGRYDETDENIETGNPTAIGGSDFNETTTDELPARDTTKNLVAKFREREEGGSSNSNQSLNTEPADELPAPNTTKNMTKFFSDKTQESKDTKSKPPQIDIPRHHNGVSNGTSENVPVELPADVVRANDPAQDDRPKQGITKNIRTQFENRSNN